MHAWYAYTIKSSLLLNVHNPVGGCTICLTFIVTVRDTLPLVTDLQSILDLCETINARDEPVDFSVMGKKIGPTFHTSKHSLNNLL